MTQKVTGQQRNHCRGLRSPSPLWLKLRCTYFSSPHKHWSDCSHIVANHSLGGGTWCHPHNLQWGFLAVTGKKLRRPFTHGPEPERRAWFKPVCMAHFLHDEQQMLTKGITLTAPQTTSGASRCSFIIAFPSYLGSQILAAKLPSRRCSARERRCHHSSNPITAFIHRPLSVVKPSVLQKVCVALKTCSPAGHSCPGTQTEKLFAK